MGNHWNDNGDLVVEEKTLFRQVGWQNTTGRFFDLGDRSQAVDPGGYWPVYQQIATWEEGAGWKD